MNPPRIGDIVHYRRHFDTTDTPSTCLAAIVTGLDNTGNPIVRVLAPFAEQGDYTAFPDYDTAGPITVTAHDGTSVIQEGDWTPGTWHHIH